MADAKNYRPGEGYAPDIKTMRGITRYACASCGSRYEIPKRMPANVSLFTGCRNEGCPGPVVRT
jgi:hypothetical protein